MKAPGDHATGTSTHDPRRQRWLSTRPTTAHDTTPATNWTCERVGEFAEQVARTVTGAATAAMMLVGDRLGLYAAMAGSGAVTPAVLARATGTHERYVREWLAQQAAAGMVDL